jgi:chorismate synthase
MINTYGDNFKIRIFGESHAPEIGVEIEGLKAGTSFDFGKLCEFLKRRAPGRDENSTGRREEDVPLIKSGAKLSQKNFDDRVLYECTGEKLLAVIENKDIKSGDYAGFRNVPRPGHADYPAMVRSGSDEAPLGGGPYSGRMTAPLCIAGGIALQLLSEQGISISAEAVRIGGETEPEAMKAAIACAKADGDSVGGVIACTVAGMPVGIGEPMFQGIENKIAQAVFGIPAVKGIEFGEGFNAAELRGSENNDEYYFCGSGRAPESVSAKTNHAGGILGGMSFGMPIELRVAVKPTPSIAKPQNSVNLRSYKEETLSVTGRHDPCIVPRAVPCVEAAVAIALYDLILIYKEGKNGK